MNFTVTSNKTRLELHDDVKSASKSKAKWERLGFKARIYANDSSDDLMTGLEISC